MGEKKEVVVEKKEEEITAVYKLNIHCKECARVIEQHFLQHEGVRKVNVDCAGGKVTVRGVKIDVLKIRDIVQRRSRRRVELISPIPKKEDKVVVVKEEKKKEVITTYEVKIFMHCGRCETFIKEELLKHKSIYSVKTNRNKHICTIVGVIEEKKLIEYIKERTRKNGVIISKKVEVKEEEKDVKIEAGRGGVKVEVVEKKEIEEIKETKAKEVVAPYFIPCTHPHFVDYSHPDFYHCYNQYPQFGPYYRQPHYRDLSEFGNYQSSAFLHCPHPPEFLSEENPYACSVM